MSKTKCIFQDQEHSHSLRHFNKMSKLAFNLLHPHSLSCQQVSTYETRLLLLLPVFKSYKCLTQCTLNSQPRMLCSQHVNGISVHKTYTFVQKCARKLHFLRLCIQYLGTSVCKPLLRAFLDLQLKFSALSGKLGFYCVLLVIGHSRSLKAGHDCSLHDKCFLFI